MKAKGIARTKTAKEKNGGVRLVVAAAVHKKKKKTKWWNSFSAQDSENQTPTQTQLDKDNNEGKISFYVKVDKNKKFKYRAGKPNWKKRLFII